MHCQSHWKNLKQLQKQQIIVHLVVNETPEWCNSFLLVPKDNGEVISCLDPVWLNKALIRPILWRLNTKWHAFPAKRVKYIMQIHASSRYHNLKLNEKSSYLTTISCPFGKYQYIGLLFGAAPVGNMFQKKIDGLFHDIHNVLPLMMIF